MCSCIIFSSPIVTDSKFPMLYKGKHVFSGLLLWEDNVLVFLKLLLWNNLSWHVCELMVVQNSQHVFHAPMFPNSLHSNILHHNDQLPTAFSLISKTKKDLSRSPLLHKGAKHPPTSLPRPGFKSDQIKCDLCNCCISASRFVSCQM